jgi:nitrate reductase assembly molybdenum cofactor insertion protein NarJ
MDRLSVCAGLLRYPDSTLLRRARFVPEFYDEIAHVSVEGLQELYTTTFDLNPVASLEVGWHLWGEQYERGRFLAELRGKQAAMGIDADAELPDHLTVLLQMFERESNEELAVKVGAAIDKMLKPLEEQGNPYRHVLHAVHESLATLHKTSLVTGHSSRVAGGGAA